MPWWEEQSQCVLAAHIENSVSPVTSLFSKLCSFTQGYLKIRTVFLILPSHFLRGRPLGRFHRSVHREWYKYRTHWKQWLNRLQNVRVSDKDSCYTDEIAMVMAAVWAASATGWTQHRCWEQLEHSWCRLESSVLVSHCTTVSCACRWESMSTSKRRQCRWWAVMPEWRSGRSHVERTASGRRLYWIRQLTPSPRTNMWQSTNVEQLREFSLAYDTIQYMQVFNMWSKADKLKAASERKTEYKKFFSC